MNVPEQPNPLLDPFLPALSAWAIVAAASAGLFDALGEESRTPLEIANTLNLDPAGVDRLMPVLAHLGYVEFDDGRFRLSEASRQYLTTASPNPLSNWVRFCNTQLLAMSRLQSTLSTGHPTDLYDLMRSPEELRVHQLAMAETAMPVAQWVAEHIPVAPDGAVILDIGGSHGLYSAAVCRRNAPLRAEVMELPAILDTARSVAAELGTNDVVTHFEGDIRTSDLKNGYSAVFAANLVHHLTLEELTATLEKIWNCLTPGGTIAVWDITEDSESGGLAPRLFSLFFFLTSAARCHSQLQIQNALQNARFSRIQTIRPDTPSLHTLIVARKPDA